MERRDVAVAVIGGLLVGLLFWIDPLYFPLVLLGLLLSGFFVGWRGAGWRPLALAWAVAGVFALVSDWIVNNEDKLFGSGSV